MSWYFQERWLRRVDKAEDTDRELGVDIITRLASGGCVVDDTPSDEDENDD